MAKDETRRPLSLSERFKNYCLGIAALTALILGLFNVFKGEPTAQRAWETSEKAINQNRNTLNKLNDGFSKLHLMFVHMQGQQEGYNNAKLIQKIEQLEQENEQLKGDKSVAVAKPAHTKKNCPPGWVRINGRCSKNRVAIAKAVDDAKRSATEAKRNLKLEHKMRRKAEMAKAKMQQVQLPRPMSPAKLKPVPQSLDKASSDK